jgi:signal peptidase II
LKEATVAPPLIGTPKLAWVFGLAAGGLVLDQLTKHLVRLQMAIGQVTAVAPGFNLRHVINKGGAFSLLYGNVWLLAAVSALVTIGIAVYAYRQPTLARWQAVGLGILLAGTLGNLIDRVVRGQVTDFLDLYVGAHHWPTFNVADICINVGVALLILASFTAAPAPVQEEHPR